MNEYKFHIYNPGKSYGAKPTFVHTSYLETQVGFSSVYGVTRATADAIIASGTTAGFKGVVWSERLWIDTDSYEAADAVETKLRELGYDFISFDSGGRGAHFGVLRGSAPSHLLPAQDKSWVSEHFAGYADLSLYTHLHLFRLPGTIHENSGRPKKLVEAVAGKVLVHPPDVLKDKRAYGIDTSTIRPNDGSTSVFEVARVMANSVPTRNGTRHPTLVRLAYALKDDAGVPRDVATWWVSEVNKMCEEPKSLEDIDKLIKSIYG